MKFTKALKFFSVAFTLALLGTFLVSAPAAAASIILNPTGGPPNTVVVVTGSGFTTSNTVLITWDGNPVGPGTFPIYGGTFTQSFQVPSTASPGAHTVSLYGYYNATPVPADTASTVFNVTSGLIPSATSGYVGDSVTITGSGFTAGITVPILWDGVQLSTTTASSTGTVSAVITIPASRRGDHTISTTLVTGSTTFTVNSKITLIPDNGGSGDSIAVTGTGFAYPATVTLSGMSFSSVTTSTNSQGSFSTAFVVPGTAARGTYTITATDSGGSASATFTVGQKITLSLPTGQTKVSPGDVITISGTNFSTGAVTFKLEGNLLTDVSATANASGAFSGVTFTVPNLPARTTQYKITATGTDLAEDDEFFSITPKITLTPASGTVGSQVTVGGAGFAANSNVSVSIVNNTSFAPVTANTDASGSIVSSVSFAMPGSVRGAQTIRAVDAATNAATAVFTVEPGITLTPSSGSFDETIAVAGSGFNAGSNITLTIQSGSTEYALTDTPSGITVSSGGAFSATFTVPLVPNGNWNIRAKIGNTVEASTVLAVKARIVITPTTGASGTQVAVTGYGFSTNKPISMKYNNAPLVINAVNSDANGYFTTSFNVPGTAAGTYVVEAADGFTTARADFISVAGATITTVTNQSSPGNVGMEVTISGTGFLPSTPVIVIFESTPVQVASVTSTAQGAFTATFKIPAAVAGEHTIKVTDGTTTKEFPFYMESVAPSAPALAAPVDKYKPKQPVPFSWYSVADPSGVTYELQLSLDPTFKTVLLYKTGLTGNSYTLSAADSITIDGKVYAEGKLPSAGSKTPYNWRIRAVDGASNAGEWSAVNTFTIGLILPPWMIHVWYGLGIVVALILGLWAGRRMAYQSY